MASFVWRTLCRGNGSPPGSYSCPEKEIDGGIFRLRPFVAVTWATASTAAQTIDDPDGRTAFCANMLTANATRQSRGCALCLSAWALFYRRVPRIPLTMANPASIAQSFHAGR